MSLLSARRTTVLALRAYERDEISTEALLDVIQGLIDELDEVLGVTPDDEADAEPAAREGPGGPEAPPGVAGG